VEGGSTQKFQKTEESESEKKKEHEKIIDFVNKEQFDKYLVSESEIKTLDGEIEELWADVRENRERWKIDRPFKRIRSLMNSKQWGRGNGRSL
jgi:hypothetical protein